MSGIQQASIRKCTFYNSKIKRSGNLIEFLACEGKSSTGEVVDCTFDGTRFGKESSRGFLIATDTIYTKKIVPAVVKNCKFMNAVSDDKPKELIKKFTLVTYGLLASKQKLIETTVVTGCTGELVTHQGAYAGSNPIVPKVDNNNRPIGGGATLDRKQVGTKTLTQDE